MPADGDAAQPDDEDFTVADARRYRHRMGTTRIIATSGASLVVVLTLLGGCASRKVNTPAPASPVAATPVEAPPAVLPDSAINSGIDQDEALWHVRAALNVAALSCDAGGPLVQRYNALLIQQKPTLALAYRAEERRLGAQRGALDRHMTQVYNFYADPRARAGLCVAAMDIAERFATMPAADLAGAAKESLKRLDAPVLIAQQARADPQLAARTALLPIPAPAHAAAPGAWRWRIQIGAFTGQARAEAAWALAQRRVPSLAAFAAHFEQVPASPLVRVQIGPAPDRAGAIGLCAAAAAGGFDCVPVARAGDR